MKILLLQLLVINALLHGSPLFLTPDEADDATHHLRTLIASAQNSVLIITPSFDPGLFKQALLKAINHGVSVRLVTSANAPESGAGLARFRHVDYRTVTGLDTPYKRGSLSLSLVISDNQDACIATMPLTRLNTEHDLGIVQCSSETGPVKHYHEYAKRILERSQPYLVP